jgi:hypothetical protein
MTSAAASTSPRAGCRQAASPSPPASPAPAPSSRRPPPPLAGSRRPAGRASARVGLTGPPASCPGPGGPGHPPRSP